VAAQLAEEPQLAALMLKEAWRRARRRLRIGPLYRWRFAGGAPDRLLVTPTELRRGDPLIAADLYAGKFYFSGRLVDTAGQSPFQAVPPTPGWNAELQSFEWLRHLSAAGDALAAANARALVADWQRQAGSAIAGRSHEVDVAARRAIAWLTNANLILADADLAFYRRFLRSLAREMRFLRSVAPEAPDGLPRLRARIALAYLSLCLPTGVAHMRSAARHLSDELDRQILADGVHLSRNPAMGLVILADLLPLRQTFAEQNQPVPKGLIGAIDRMLPALRFFRHGDGALALFNGAGVSEAHLMTALLRHDETLGDPISHARPSGYQRLAAGGTVVIADTGMPPPIALSGEAHAGTLAFEFSSGAHRFVVNCGAPARQDADWRRLARTTAAHSTLTVADHSSARFSSPGLVERFLGAPLIGGPRRVPVSRDDSDAGQRFTAAHDGYAARFGLAHERTLFLARGGGLIEGADRLFPAGKRPVRLPDRTPAALRFHLHPGVAALRTGEGVTLAAGREEWHFSASAPVEIEDSIFFADNSGARRTLQIVVPFDPRDHDAITWRFVKRR
jgi:uncharacterized heparinase superfamily protein